MMLDNFVTLFLPFDQTSSNRVKPEKLIPDRNAFESGLYKLIRILKRFDGYKTPNIFESGSFCSFSKLIQFIEP